MARYKPRNLNAKLKEWGRKYPKEFSRLLKEYENDFCPNCGTKMVIDEEADDVIFEDRWVYTMYRRRVFKRIGIAVFCPRCGYSHYITVDVIRMPKKK